MAILNAIPNSKLIEQIRAIASGNKEIVFIHNHDTSLFVQIPSRKFDCKIDLTSPMANSQLTACNLTLQFVNDGMNDYIVTFSPKNKKMFTLKYDVKELNPKLAEIAAAKDLQGDGISRSDYKAKAQVKLINQVRSAA